MAFLYLEGYHDKIRSTRITTPMFQVPGVWQRGLWASLVLALLVLLPQAGKAQAVSITIADTQACEGDAVPTVTATITSAGQPDYDYLFRILDSGQSPIGGFDETINNTASTSENYPSPLTASTPGTYYFVIIITDDTSAVFSDTTGPFVIVGEPDQADAISGAANACTGTVESYGTGFSTPADSFFATIPGGSGTFVASGTTTLNGVSGGTINFDIAWASAGTHTITIFQTDNGCPGPDRTLDVDVATTPGPPSYDSGALSVCGNDAVTYTITGVGSGNDVTWSIPAGSGTITGGTTTRTGTDLTSIEVTWNTVGSPTVRTITVSQDNSGCVSTDLTFNVTVNPLPATPTPVGGSTTVCGASVETYEVNGTGTLIWALAGGGTITNAYGGTIISAGAGATGTDMVDVTWGTSSGTFDLDVYADNGTCQSADYTFSVGVTAIPTTPTFNTGLDDEVCGDTTAHTYTLAGPPGSFTFEWRIPSGSGEFTPGLGDTVAIQSGPGSDVVDIYWFNTTAASAVRTIRVSRAQSGCPSAFATYDVTVHKKPEPTITGPTAVEAATVHNFSNPTFTAGNTVVWNITPSSGATIIASSNTSATVTFGPTATGTYTVSAEETNPSISGCVTTVTYMVSATTCANTVGAPSGDAIICAGDSINVSVASFNGNIRWQRATNFAGPYVNETGTFATNQLYNTGPLPTGTYYYRAEVTSNNVACPAVYSSVITIDVQNAPTVGFATGVSDICVSTSTQIYVESWTGASLQWEQATSASGPWTTATSPGPTDSDTLTTPVFGSAQTIFYRALISSACTDIISNVVEVRVNPGPVGTILTADGQTVCVNDAFSISATASVGTGIWTTNGGGLIADPNNPNTTYTPAVLDAGQIVGLNWVVRNGDCPPNSSTINISVPAQQTATLTFPVTPPANPCAGTAIQMIGSSNGGVGHWLIQNELVPGSSRVFDLAVGFVDASYFTSNSNAFFLIGPSEAGNPNLRIVWETFGTGPASVCTTPISRQRTFSVAAAAVGGSIISVSNDSICDTDIINLTAFRPAGTTGSWTTNGNGTFSNPTGVSTTYDPDPTDATAGEITINWVVTNPGACGTQENIDSRIIQVRRAPDGELVSAPSAVCVSNRSGRFRAFTNAGTGQWITNGNGIFYDYFSFIFLGTLVPTTTSPFVLYQPDASDADQILTVNWQVSNTNGCGTDDNTTNLIVYGLSTGSFATTPDTICIDEPTATLGATINPASLAATGLWLSSGDGGFTNSSDPNARYIPTGSDSGTVVTLSWLVANGTCAPTVYQQDLYVRAPSAGSFTTPLGIICEGQVSDTLRGFTNRGVGHWETPNGLGTFLNTNPAFAANPEFDSVAVYQSAIGDGAQPVIIRWVVDNGGCQVASYDRDLTVLPLSLGTFDSAPDSVCRDASTGPLGAFAIHGEGRWRVSPAGAGTFDDITDGLTRFTPNPTRTVDETVTLTWVVQNSTFGAGPCDSVAYSQQLFVTTINPVVTPDTAICRDDSFNLSATGGDTYLWSPSTGLDDPTIANPLFTPVDGINIYDFTVTITRNRCTSQRDVRITLDDGGTLSAFVGLQAVAADDSVCAGGTAVLGVDTSNVIPGTYVWTPATNLSNPNSPNPTVSNIMSTTEYTVIAQTNSGCFISDNVVVDVYPGAPTQLASGDNCLNNPQFLQATQVANCTRTLWFTGDRSTVEAAGPLDETNPLYIVDGDPTATIDSLRGVSDDLLTYSYTYVCIDQFGCENVRETTYEIKPQPIADFVADVTEVSFFNRTVTFTNLSSQPGETPVFEWLWDFGDTLSGDSNRSTLPNPQHVYSTSGSFPVTLYLITEIGCSQIEIKPNYINVDDPSYEFPTAFSPNGDATNEFFRPLPYDPEDADRNEAIASIDIFDRWGNLIYSVQSPGDTWVGWDGTINGEPADIGTYTYRALMEVEIQTGLTGETTRQPLRFSGTVTLLR